MIVISKEFYVHRNPESWQESTLINNPELFISVDDPNPERSELF